MVAQIETVDTLRRLLREGRPQQAEQLGRQVLCQGPADCQAWLLVGEACRTQGKRDEALACYRQALGCPPASAAGATDLGVALAQAGVVEEALVAFRAAVRLDTSYAPAHHNLGVALAQQGRHAEALASFGEALRLRPDYTEAHYNLGNALRQMGKRAEALASYQEAVRLRPDYAEALNNLGLVLSESGRPAEATVLVRQAIRLQPELVEAHNNLGLALADLGRFGEAIGCYEEALRRNPRYAEAHGNLGNAYMAQGRLEEAVACHEQALRLQGDFVSAHWNRALAWLLQGKYEAGWPEYEWRWRRQHTPPRPFAQPTWDGSPLDGRTILLWCEQGLGDAIQFVRYARLVQERGGGVILECPGSLLSLFRSVAGVDQVIAEGMALPAFDVQVPLMSLPARFGTTLASVPADVPYLVADGQQVERWRERLAGLAGFRVGICWQGNPHHKWDRHRSVPLRHFAPLAQVPGAHLVSLQKGAGSEQVRTCTEPVPIREFGDALDGRGGFGDTAALIRCLDLVVTVDTAVAHLAGALGVPVWLALSTVVDWRWLLEREETPWYPTMRLFWQTRQGEWEPVFARMAVELRRRIEQPSPSGVMWAPATPGELLDKLTILRIKTQRMKEPAKLVHVRAELNALEAVWSRSLYASAELDGLEAQLRRVNELLWDVEDELRRCERAQDFGSRFIELARSVYRHNDARAALKRQVNELLGALFAEQKSYALTDG